nr:murinoglobulin-2-like [Meriones unguiculatus]
MVLVPSQLLTETPEKICLHLYHLNETVTVTATLLYGWGNRSLFNELVVDKDLFRCVSFTLPRLSLSEEKVSLSVHIKGPTHEFSKKTVVLVKNKESVVFLQTDKPVYKPGQSVNFRVVSMDKNLHPLNELFPVVYIEDPKTNRIMQWQNISTENGLKQLSFSLSLEPILGSYKIVIQKQSGEKKEHSFTVEEFVLPRFEVQVKVPKAIYMQEEKINVTAFSASETLLVCVHLSCDRYTYGKPVPGQAKISICLKYLYFSLGEKPECKEVSYQLEKNGCITQEENITMFQVKKSYDDYKYLRVNANVKEEGTGFEFSGSGTTKIERTTTKLVFVKADSDFRPGIPFRMKVRLVDVNDIPLPNEQVFIKLHEAGNTIAAITDQDGLAEFSINTTSIAGSYLTIKVYHKKENLCLFFPCMEEQYAEAQHEAYRVYTESRSYVYLEIEPGILPCSQIHTVQAHFILNGPVLLLLRELNFYYLVMAQGKIVHTGSHTHHMEPSESCQQLTTEQQECLPNAVPPGPLKGHFTLEIPVEFSMAPVAKMLIYAILPDGEVIANSAKFEIEKCLLNKVRSLFSEISIQKGANYFQDTDFRCVLQWQICEQHQRTRFQFTNPEKKQGSGEQEREPNPIYNLPEMQHKDLTPRSHQLSEEDHYNMGDTVTYLGPDEYDKDVYEYIEYNVHFVHYTFIGSTKYDLADARLEPEVTVANKNLYHGDSTIETFRKYFPETWVWDLVTVNSSGLAEMEVTVPDTITEWKAGAFCLSNATGLGLSPVVSLQAFQPFFVELTMPYSVIRGEAFTLKANVLNYLPTCIRLGVQLAASPDFTAVPVEKAQDSYCLCANGRHTTSWLVTPKSLGNVNFSVTAEALQSPEPCGSEVATVPDTGRKDTVVKVLLVEPEGIQEEHTFSSLLCASDAELSEKLSLVLPPTVVNDSARAHFSVLGDILSSAIKNIQNLLHMPYGCGEQNMVLFAPNIYVLKYLNETQQLTQKIKTKAIDYLNAGYQRELNYKHKDGSYSAFGDRNGKSQGNTWLTAFVLKSFAQAQAFIFIDEAHITHAFNWLSQQQQDNGCFRSSGSLFNNDIKGGVDDEVTLSAYITIALLESSLPDTHPVVSKALSCLESSWKTAEQNGRSNSVYTKALLAYAFTLAGNQQKRNEILESLDNEAIKEGNSVHWERPEKPRKAGMSLYEPQAPSAEVEMNAYVLLAVLSAQPAPTPKDLALAVRIVKWLTKQQNSYGGFSSTQDTVVALHALSKYGAATFSRSQKTPLVTIQSSGTFSQKFQVEDSNRLLLQQVLLPDLPGDYEISVTEGCVYAQTTLKYNVHWEKQQSAFALRVQTVPLTCDNPEGHNSFQISLEMYPRAQCHGGKGFLLTTSQTTLKYNVHWEKQQSAFALRVQTVPLTCDNPEGHNSFQISLEISYTGSRPASNMVIADVKMISGFIPLKPTVKKLERSEHVSRTEVSMTNVLLYLDQVTNQTLAFSFIIQQEIPVKNLQPAIVKVYDYYETDEAAFAEYSMPCSTEKPNF